MKVVWICQFSNSTIQKYLPLVKMPPQYSTWITHLIEEFKELTEIELHIISPIRWLKNDFCFKLEGINYHFIKTGIPFISRHWPAFFKFDYFTNFYFNKKKIKKIVNSIKPDIINLHGAENPIYSSSIFNLKSYPILITIQGFISLDLEAKDFQSHKRIKIEEKILKEFNHFGIRAKFMSEYISSFNPEARFYWFKYPFKSLISSSEKIEKETYDCVFFARITKDKGIEDLIKAISLVREEIPDILLKIIGGGYNISYKNFLLDEIKKRNLNSNITFLGFIPTQEDVHRIVAGAKITVLPTYNDVLPGTIIESLRMGIPVVAYSANGVVDFNSELEIIKLVNVGDINGLANLIVKLLKDKGIREKMSINGKYYVSNVFNNKVETKKMIEAYKEVISNYEN